MQPAPQLVQANVVPGLPEVMPTTDEPASGTPEPSRTSGPTDAPVTTDAPDTTDAPPATDVTPSPTSSTPPSLPKTGN